MDPVSPAPSFSSKNVEKQWCFKRLMTCKIYRAFNLSFPLLHKDRGKYFEQSITRGNKSCQFFLDKLFSPTMIQFNKNVHLKKDVHYEN